MTKEVEILIRYYYIITIINNRLVQIVVITSKSFRLGIIINLIIDPCIITRIVNGNITRIVTVAEISQT